MIIFIEGSLEVKLPTIWTDGKAEVGRVREEKGRREKIREEKEWEERRCRRAKRQESRETLCFFRWFVAPAGRKVGSLKRRVRSHLARWEMKNCTPLWHEAHPEVNNVQNTSCFGRLLEIEMSKKCTPLLREAHFQVKMYKAHQCRTTFRSWDVEKVHAAVARSTFPSQNGQNTPAPDHFWKLRCRKKCTPLWREAHVQVKMYKTYQPPDHFWKLRCRKSARRCGAKHISTSKVQKTRVLVALLDVRMSFCVAGTRDSAPCQKQKREGFVAVSATTTTALHYITLHYTPLQLQLQLIKNYNYNHNYITLHYATLRYTKYTTLHYTTLTFTLHCTRLHYTIPHYSTQHYNTRQYTTRNCTTPQLQLQLQVQLH